MSATRSLLVELQVEELPPKALKKLGEAFASVLADGLRDAGLADSGSAVNLFATPRRLAAHISHVRAVAPDRPHTHKLMPVAVGLGADGVPTQALHKKLTSLGLGPDAVPRLRRVADGKAEVLVLDTVQPGQTLAQGLQQALAQALAKLPIPKLMQYQLADGWRSVHFVRPAHGLVALHGAEVVPVQALGLEAGRQTRGHRFEAAVDPVMLQDADHYERQLEAQGAVIASFSRRRQDILAQLQQAAAQLGAQPVDDEALLDEVTGLVERPKVLVCEFPREFLAVPAPCLILTMKANQKYFPLLDAQGQLTHRFLVVSNIQPADASRVVQGNERVVKPRLADAKFFFDQDRKKTLDSRVPALDRVVYHGKLGSQGARVQRVQAIVQELAAALGDAAFVADCTRAARLAKSDLLSDMVGEFPELQGTMGALYARHDGEPEAVAQAIEDHYKPRFAGDSLPRGEVGLALALADKLETLAGLFGIGERPTGDKDPYALRRHALGVIRMLIERAPPLSLPDLLAAACKPFATLPGWTDPRAELEKFCLDRLVVLLRDQGWRAQEVDAVLARLPQHWHDIPRRLQAVRDFAELPEAAALAAANKRVVNILTKAGPAEAAAVLDAALLVDPAEQALAAVLARIGPEAEARFAQGDHTASLRLLAQLKEPVDAFFDGVMVNAQQAALRANRLALLGRLRDAMNRVADLSRLAS